MGQQKNGQPRRSLNWTCEEKQLIMEFYKQFGPNWKKINDFLPNRDPNSIKNKVNCCEKKFVNRVNTCLRPLNKSIQISALTKFLFLISPDSATKLTEQEKHKFLCLRNQIIEHFLRQPLINSQMAIEIYNELKQFNISFRHTNARRLGFLLKNKGIKVASREVCVNERQHQLSIQNVKKQQESGGDLKHCSTRQDNVKLEDGSYLIRCVQPTVKLEEEREHECQKIISAPLNMKKLATQMVKREEPESHIIFY